MFENVTYYVLEHTLQFRCSLFSKHKKEEMKISGTDPKLRH